MESELIHCVVDVGRDLVGDVVDRRKGRKSDRFISMACWLEGGG